MKRTTFKNAHGLTEKGHLSTARELDQLNDFPSIQFGLEQAFLSFENSNPFTFFASKFSEGTDAININGLIWMGDKQFMKDQIANKIEQGPLLAQMARAQGVCYSMAYGDQPALVSEMVDWARAISC